MQLPVHLPLYGADRPGVAEQAWAFRCDLDVAAADDEQVDIVFEGLDTFAHVYVDGRLALSSDNMFVPVRLAIALGQHRILIHFESPLVRARELQTEYGHHHRHVVSNGEVSRPFVRKAQYSWGWDWGPRLLSIGPWRPIRLETYLSRIDELCVGRVSRR